jgi:hypothetical protein
MKTFTDIRSHWAKQEIELLASKLIVNGTSDTVFAPNATLTRAEFAVIVARALGLSDQAGDSSKLNDVISGSWYSDAVGAAVHAGIITGYQDGSFKPQQHVTREEMAVMLSRAAAYIGAVLGSGTNTESLLAPYTDGSRVSEWAQAAVSELIASELLLGNQNGLLNPKANLTRAEMAVVMKRFLLQVGFIS